MTALCFFWDCLSWFGFRFRWTHSAKQSTHFLAGKTI